MFWESESIVYGGGINDHAVDCFDNRRSSAFGNLFAQSGDRLGGTRGHGKRDRSCEHDVWPQYK